jgi:hypothetical protein
MPMRRIAHRYLGAPFAADVVMTHSTGRGLLEFLLGVICCGQLACSDGRTIAIGNSDSGQTVALSVGDELDVTLGSIGGNPGDPAVSSTAIRYQASSGVGLPNPGGPTILYKFAAVRRGAATITIPFLTPSNPPPFTVDVNVE